jgi:SAM-dependent methyltransferase
MKKKCNVCLSNDVKSILNLPKYPLNSLYLPKNDLNIDKYYKNFELFSCNDCGHIFGISSFQLSELYNDDYNYRPTSPNIQWRVEFLISKLTVYKGIKFNRIIDIGCYNGQLLKRAKDILSADYFIGVDPSMPNDVLSEKSDIIFIKDFIQNVDLPHYNQNKPDLILSDQVFEHIDDLNEVVNKLYEVVSPNSKFCICVPSLEAMLDKLNFQFIIHEHLNYFSANSIKKLFCNHGLYMENCYIDYQSTSNFMLSFFEKGNETEQKNTNQIISTDAFLDHFNMFKQNLESNLKSIKKLSLLENVYGFGASDLTSNLAYFMNTEFNFLCNILDDTQWKNNNFMIGINAEIKNPENSKVELYKNSYCLITAPQASRHLINRINTLGFKCICIPTIGFL